MARSRMWSAARRPGRARSHRELASPAHIGAQMEAVSLDDENPHTRIIKIGTQNCVDVVAVDATGAVLSVGTALRVAWCGSFLFAAVERRLNDGHIDSIQIDSRSVFGPCLVASLRTDLARGLERCRFAVRGDACRLRLFPVPRR